MNLPPPGSQPRRRWRLYRITTIVPFLLFLTVSLAFWLMMGRSSAPEAVTTFHLKYSTVPGFFLQDDPGTDPDTFDYVQQNFGLIDQPYDTDTTLPQSEQSSIWQRFEHKLQTLNKVASRGSTYRLLFLGRHGQGWHNVAESYYGTVAWDCYYAALNGSSEITWLDAHLTSIGVTQAETARSLWRSRIESQAVPTPHRFYTSPLTRAIQTANVTFSDLKLSPERPFKLIVKELLREGIGIHTCDRRSRRTSISSSFSGCEIEKGFTEDDELWLPDLRESDSAQTERLRKLLDDIFEHESKDTTIISMTSHGGSIASILRAVGHREFKVETGGVIPILIKVERVAGERERGKIEPWTPKPECEEEVLRKDERLTDAFKEYIDNLGLSNGI